LTTIESVSNFNECADEIQPRLVEGRLQGEVTEEANGGTKVFELKVERKTE